MMKCVKEDAVKHCRIRGASRGFPAPEQNEFGPVKLADHIANLTWETETPRSRNPAHLDP
jgi:hypothetical protein